jgi:hypothetical protein
MAEFSYDLLPMAPVPNTDTDAAQPIGSGLTDAEGNPANQQTAHVRKAGRRLIKFFHNKPRVQAFLAAFVQEVQEMEDLAWAVFATLRDLDTAEGVLLDRLGALVDESRVGRLDGPYRAAIRVKILCLSSDGKTEQMYEIARLLEPTATVAISESWPAGFQVSFSVATLGLTYLYQIMKIAKPAGVRMNLGFAGGAIGDTDGDPLGATIGDTDGVPLGGAIGLAL